MKGHLVFNMCISYKRDSRTRSIWPKSGMDEKLPLLFLNKIVKKFWRPYGKRFRGPEDMQENSKVPTNPENPLFFFS